jgi:hypothetical protein
MVWRKVKNESGNEGIIIVNMLFVFILWQVEVFVK